MSFKLMFAFIFAVYVIYNALYLNNTNIYAGYAVKYVKVQTKKDYYKSVRRKNRCCNNTRTRSYGLFLRLLLLCSGIESHPGPTSVECPTCNQSFNRQSRLEAHRLNASPLSCEICGVVYCHESRKQQHMLREHVGAGIDGSGGGRSPLNPDFDTPILPPTGYHETAEYKAAIDEHYSTIRSQTNAGSEWRNVNV